MNVGSTMRGMGRSAREKAEAMGHSVKDRALEKRLERASDEAERLRMENDMLRGEVSETRHEHRRILDLLETKLSNPPEIEVEIEKEKKSHKGRWFLFFAALGGAYAWVKMRASGNGRTDEWGGHLNDTPTSGTGTSSM